MMNLERLEQRRLLAAGDVDASFGDGGIVREQAPDAITVDDTIVTPDGKIVIAGSVTFNDDGNYDYLLRRYNADGTPDNTFSGDGTASGRVGGAPARIFRIQPAPGGKIIAMVQSQTSDGESPITNFIVRFNGDGSLDTTFSDDGFTVVAQGDALGISVSEGKVLVAHGHDLTRYTADGAVDTSFGTNGSIHSEGTVGTTMTLADGSILMNEVFPDAPQGERYFVTKREADGTLVTSFGQNGTIALPFYVYHLNTVAGGKILVTGEIVDNSATHQALRRYNADGSLDTTFASGDGEIIVTQTGSTMRTFFDDAGRIYLTGFIACATRLTPDGVIDPEFGKIYADLPDFIGFPAGLSGDRLIFAGAFFPDIFSRRAEFGVFARLTEDDGKPSAVTLSDATFSVTGSDAGERIVIRDGPFVGAMIDGFGRGFEPDEVDRIIADADGGDDIIICDLGTRGAHVKGGSGRDKIAGGLGNDTLEGNAQRDFIDGGEGDDLIVGNGGRDQLRGQSGNDSLGGGAWDDYIEGNDGNDHLEGGIGNDILHGDIGNDTFKTDDGDIDSLFGDAGDDSMVARDDDDVLSDIEST